MDAWPVWVVVGGIVLVVSLASLAGSRRGREHLEERAIQRALRTKVRDVMSSPVISVSEDSSVEEAARSMLQERIGSLPVVNAGGVLAGVLTESDVTGVRDRSSAPGGTLRSEIQADGLRAAYDRAGSRRVADVMTRQVVTTTEDEAVSDLVLVMIRNELRHVPVVREGSPVGIVARHDLLRLLTAGQSEGSSVRPKDHSSLAGSADGRIRKADQVDLLEGSHG